jgi:hypothetical protein
VHLSRDTLMRGWHWPLVLLLAIAAMGTPGFSVHLGSSPELSVVSVQDLGAIPTVADILGRDGGYSAEFQGQSVWLYGDTFLSG